MNRRVIVFGVSALMAVLFALPSVSGSTTMPGDQRMENRVTTELYPEASRLIPSPGHTVFYVDPVNGSESNTGRTLQDAWRSLANVNHLRLGPGDRVVIAPGELDETLKPTAFGTNRHPVCIQLLAGKHVIRATRAIRLSYFISNSADNPTLPRPIGILVKGCRHLNIVGEHGCELVYGDRMTLFINDSSEDIRYSGLSFDLSRPTVSEFRVDSVAGNVVEVTPADGSTYKIEGGHFSWTGDLGPGWTMVQEATPADGSCWRRGQWDPFAGAVAQQLVGGKVRLTYAAGNPGLQAGHCFQFRNIVRDTTSAANLRSKNIVFQDCNFRMLPGMGIVSQFTENITFERVNVQPKEGAGRTCAAWADCFHFSGCRGDVRVEGCHFSGTQDDPINVHGTFLRIVERTGANRLKIRFMHPQTYGFDPFVAGDGIDFVSHISLKAYGSSTVTEVHRVTDKDWEIVLAGPSPDYTDGDVVDNVSWYPNVTIRGCVVTMDSTRGFLITTRGKVIVENNTFHNTAMSAIDIADDANSWYESGGVKDVTIRRNHFIHCGEPAIYIHPENRSSHPGEQVHQDIKIIGNLFEKGLGISAKSVRGLTIVGNQFLSNRLPLQTEACEEVAVENNHFIRE